MDRRLLLCAVFAVTACRDVNLPPLPGPGSVQGRAVFAIPGRTELQPAADARFEVLGTGLTARSNADGRFVLKPLTSSKGQLVVRFDAADGERLRVFRLESLGAAPGLDLEAGELILSRNALVRGRILRSDIASTRGLGGTVVFAPGGPWSTFTADDGTFELPALPSGQLQLSAFFDGYSAQAVELELGGGEERVLQPLVLEPETPGPASVKARIVLQDGSPATGARARARHLGAEAPLTLAGDATLSVSGVTPGVYSFAFERDGSLPVTVLNVLLLEGENDLGTITLLDGASTGTMNFVDPGVWDGGPPLDSGVVDAGVDGGTDAGVDAGVDAGEIDAGFDAGIDAGMLPVALASGPAVATPGAQVTLSGMSSTGDFPLIYRWTQTGGTTVTLNTNNTALSHSPRFTAPAAGTIVTFELVVEDRFGVLSAPSAVSVGIGVTPIARFVPDASVVFSGQNVQLTSTSVDDAGVVLVSYRWRLATGSPGTVITDGGPTAVWIAPMVAFGSPNQLGGVTLDVTNAIGATSAPFTNFYTVSGVAPFNWSLDAGPTQNVAVPAAPPQVVLSGSISTTIPNPQYTVQWSCPPSVTLLAPDTLTPRFAAPTIVGPTVTLLCQVQVVGQPPLDPPMLSGSVNVLLRDTAPPLLVSTRNSPTRISRFGYVGFASEPLSAVAVAGANEEHVVYRGWTSSTNYTPIDEGDAVAVQYVSLSDFAQPTPITNNNIQLTPTTLYGASVWTGPYESVQTYADPRPVIATLGQLPGEVQAMHGVMAPPVPYELVGLQPNGNLIRFTGLDLSQQPTCDPTPCPLMATEQALGLTPFGLPPGFNRAVFAGPELMVTTSTDGGSAPFVARRSSTGTWSAFGGLNGTPGVQDEVMKTMRFDGVNTISRDTWDPATSSFTRTEIVDTTQTQVWSMSTAGDFVAAIVGPSRSLFARRRNPVDLTWSTPSLSAPQLSPNGFTAVKVTADYLALAFVESANGLHVMRLDYAFGKTIASGAIQGWDVAVWGAHNYIVYSLGGDIRLRLLSSGAIAGAGSGSNISVDFGGPPRAGYSPPYPVMLDSNPMCEAVYPQFAFIEDALVIVWQERCSPATQWKVMARVIR